ncbi:hypothetical protein K3N28_12535 [Glycomyces sp. TRM65418]|uniref:hypothetical protein n=1 Tax=Glycomyces sp. TRM65418 TaxID=2867006 RepID=UPI001CE4C4E7|nr:hypothetical protein [Glycomyces sp. TRM65418]MCC3763891.1 hypothetical protein [Glycomyces sp. TRM65418]QZD53594.1 hypothetical protein K3N28_12465 [Glycomyces sp. TRM65418]
MAWWQWTGLACLGLLAAGIAVMARIARYYEDHQMGLDWGPGPDGTRVLLDTENNNSNFEQWVGWHVQMERDFRGPNPLPSHRPPGRATDESADGSDWIDWWLERLSYCDEHHYENPARVRERIVQARREAGLPELSTGGQDSAG